MLLLRLIGILTAIGIGAGIFAWLLTGDRRYLRLSIRLAKYAFIIVLILFSLLAFERLIVVL